MVSTTKPNDVLRRYVLRKGAFKKVRHRLSSAVRHGTREVFGDAGALLPDARTVFDVGANIGYVAHDFTKRWPNASITCFEPTPETFERLRANVGDLARVTCVQAAVADHDGTATFHVDNKAFGGGANSLLDHAAEFALTAPRHDYRPIEVPAVRLDTYCEQQGIDHVDLLKLDIEGAEPLAIRGAERLLSRSAVDIIVSEVRLVPGYADGALMHELIDQLGGHGYRPFGVYRFAASEIGQSLWGDVMFLGPAFRRQLVDRHGAAACGFLD
jgi:FkbM family methyltransferase